MSRTDLYGYSDLPAYVETPVLAMKVLCKKSRRDKKCAIVQTGEENLVLMNPLLSSRLIKIATLNKLIQ